MRKAESEESASHAFESKLRMLQSDVLAHTESEEREEFDELAAVLDGDLRLPRLTPGRVRCRRPHPLQRRPLRRQRPLRQ